MRKKRAYTKKVQPETERSWTDPNPDPYGFEKLISKLKSAGYNAVRENGIAMVYVTDSIDKHYDKIKSIVDKQGFTSSWGVKLQR